MPAIIRTSVLRRSSMNGYSNKGKPTVQAVSPERRMSKQQRRGSIGSAMCCGAAQEPENDDEMGPRFEAETEHHDVVHIRPQSRVEGAPRVLPPPKTKVSHVVQINKPIVFVNVQLQGAIHPVALFIFSVHRQRCDASVVHRCESTF